MMRVVILADESADWKIAGLRQLDRLAFSIQEYLKSTATGTTICIFWKPSTPPAQRWVPRDERLRNVHFTDDVGSLGDNVDLVLSTRVLIYRGGFEDFADAIKIEIAQKDWPQLFEELERVATASPAQHWEYIRNADSIAASETRFLRALAKPSDGPISRTINRPVSRVLSRLLLRSTITPNQCSALTALIALPACFALSRGSYCG